MAAVDADRASWTNQRLRKLYPVDAGSLREGQSPNCMAFRLETGTQLETLCEEHFDNLQMVGFYPPLPNTIKSPLYFADYAQEEYEPVFDENMLVYTFAELDAGKYSRSEGRSAVEGFLFLRDKHTEATGFSSLAGTTLVSFTGHSCSMLQVKSASVADLQLWNRLRGSAGAILAR
jgi:hypothetical protein